MTADGLVLAFDTATESIAIGLGWRRGTTVEVLATRDFEAPRAAMTGLLPAVSSLLAEASFCPEDIRQVVVGRGPGSFTGVRIGVATAKGIAHGLGVDLFGVGTLDAIAWGVPAEWSGTLGVLGDAMRGEVYPAIYDVSHGASGRTVHRTGADAVAAPADAAREWSALDRRITLAGNGLAKYAALFEDALGSHAEFAPQSWWPPSGAGLLQGFGDAISQGVQIGGGAGVVLPVYTRLSDAEETERARAGLGPVAPPDTGVGGPPYGGTFADDGPAVAEPSS